ncbi:LemA family protein [Saccharicrinis sp. FJH2]|uniref:LemA family protein n=1 Tax=Saccharicrinis sp. FJH65 TaxID=3344659 RepID=UPI0035F22078
MKKSLIAIIAVVVFIFIVVSWGVGKTNKLKVADEAVSAQWAQVENVYQRRMDLIPNLVNTVKGYAAHEQETLTAVVEARAKATSTNINADNMSASQLAQFQQSQEALSSALSRLMVVVEKYPDLKANQNFLELQAQLEGTENRIATERRRFNQVAQNFNTSIRTFPGSFFANMAGLEKRPYFSAQEGASQAPEVKF